MYLDEFFLVLPRIKLRQINEQRKRLIIAHADKPDALLKELDRQAGKISAPVEEKLDIAGFDQFSKLLANRGIVEVK